MAAKKTQTVEEQFEGIILSAIKKRMPDLIQNFFDCMNEGTDIERGLEFFGDYLYDDGFADITNDISDWARNKLAIKTSVVLKTQIEK
jgi:hypothetical protein